MYKSRLSLIVGVNVVLNRTVVVDGDWRFDNLCGSHLQSQSELYHVSSLRALNTVLIKVLYERCGSWPQKCYGDGTQLDDYVTS